MLYKSWILKQFQKIEFKFLIPITVHWNIGLAIMQNH